MGLKKHPVIFPLILAMVLLSCGTGKTDRKTAGSPAKSEGKDAGNNAWVNHYNTNIDSLVSLYSPDAVVVSENGMVSSGREAIRESLAGLKRNTGRVKSARVIRRVQANETYDYEIGRFRAASGDYAYLAIYQQKDGRVKRELEFVAKADKALVTTDEITAARDLWMTFCNRHDAGALVRELYLENAVYYNHKPVITGAEAIAKEYRYMNNPAYRLALTPIISEAVNDSTVLEIGQCSGSYGGKYLLVWRKNKEGRWKILLDSNI
jgi:ketosteroid isomerase-like protein